MAQRTFFRNQVCAAIAIVAGSSIGGLIGIAVGSVNDGHLIQYGLLGISYGASVGILLAAPFIAGMVLQKNERVQKFADAYEKNLLDLFGALGWSFGG